MPDMELDFTWLEVGNHEGVFKQRCDMLLFLSLNIKME